MLSVTVNKELGVPVRLLKKAADPRIMRTVSRALAEETLKCIQDGFKRAIAPNGEPWAPLKYRNGEPLRKNGHLLESIHLNSEMIDGGFTISTNQPYAPYHQFGTSGHKASSRVQPVNKRGKFMKKNKAASSKANSVGFRILNFKAGGGAIPARPFMPIGGIPSGWVPRLNAAGNESLQRLMK